MNSRERYVRALTCDGPDRVPLVHAHLPGAVNVHGRRLAELYARYPSDVLSSPLVIGETGRSGQGGNFAFHDHPRGLGTLGETTYDEWGCGWYWNTADNMGQAVVHPLEDWAAFDAYRSPDPMVGIEGIAFVEEMVRRDDHQHFVFVDAGELVQRIWFLRGYENALIDTVEEPPELGALIDLLVDWNLERIYRWHETGAIDGFLHRDDWGTQTALAIDPAAWRKLFKPAYRRIVDAIHEGGAYAAFHTDGYVLDIIPDLIEIGWDEINPQVHLMDIEELGRRYGGKICFRADIDRQHTLPYGSPEDVRRLVTRCFDAFGRFNGGYVGTGQAHADVPLENIEAVLETVYGFTYGGAPSNPGPSAIG